jgi:hypothetical protein
VIEMKIAPGRDGHVCGDKSTRIHKTG